MQRWPGNSTYMYLYEREFNIRVSRPISNFTCYELFLIVATPVSTNYGHWVNVCRTDFPRVALFFFFFFFFFFTVEETTNNTENDNLKNFSPSRRHTSKLKNYRFPKSKRERDGNRAP